MSVPDAPSFHTQPLFVSSSSISFEFFLGLNNGSAYTDVQYARSTDGYTTWTSLGLVGPIDENSYNAVTISGLVTTSYGLYKIRAVNGNGNSDPSSAQSVWRLYDAAYYSRIKFSTNNQYAIAINQSNYSPVVSSNGGVTWTAISPPTADDCFDVAMSANGSYMYYASYGGGLFRSTDYGVTFTQLTTAPLTVPCIACDSTGQKIYCPNDNTGDLYVSNDYGATFTLTASLGIEYYGIICSANGQYVYTYYPLDGSPNVHVSTNYGVSFTVKTMDATGTVIKDIACDQTGKIIYFATDIGVACSVDYGETFQKLLHPDVSCEGIACNSLANRVITMDSTGIGYVSYDAGTIWTSFEVLGQNLLSNVFFGVSISPDGTRYVYVHRGTYIKHEGTADDRVWTVTSSIKHLLSGSISTNNQNIVVTYYNGTDDKYDVAYSNDSGDTWNLVPVAGGDANKVVASASGQNVLVLVDGTLPYFSTDYGATFTITTLSPTDEAIPDWHAVINSAGTSMMTISYSGYVYVSADSAATWANPHQFTDVYIRAICSSASMDRIYVLVGPIMGGISSLYVSTNMGTSWTSLGDTPSPYGVADMACDWSGQNVVLLSDLVYRSTNGGVSWTQSTETGGDDSYYISSNSTGNRLVTMEEFDGIYGYTGVYNASIDAGVSFFTLSTPTIYFDDFYHTGNISPDGTFAMISTYERVYFQTLGAADLPSVPPVPCFIEGSKILCQVDGVETYMAVETIRPGTLVKTSRDGFQPVKLIGSRSMTNVGGNQRDKNSLYICTKEHYPELTEDLIITGCHAILVDQITETQRQGIVKTLERIFVTDKKYRLPACVDERASIVQTAGTFTVWHFALEHTDIKMNYGVYAHGLLVESSPIWHMNTKNYNLVQ